MRTQVILLAMTFALALVLASCSESESEKERQAQPDSATVTVYVTRTGKKYHRGGCQYLRQSKIATALEDAKGSGYTPCSRCGPPQ